MGEFLTLRPYHSAPHTMQVQALRVDDNPSLRAQKRPKSAVLHPFDQIIQTCIAGAPWCGSARKEHIEGAGKYEEHSS